jgi:hypothetical protein
VGRGVRSEHLGMPVEHVRQLFKHVSSTAERLEQEYIADVDLRTKRTLRELRLAVREQLSGGKPTSDSARCVERSNR